MKLISFAIPSYNSEAYLHHAVETIITGGEEVEIIIVNDGSTDNSHDRVKDFHDSRIVYLSKENGGVASARNMGLDYATGEYCAFIDADDELNKDTYLEELIAQSEYDYVVGGLTHGYFTNGVELRRNAVSPGEHSGTTLNEMPADFFIRGFVHTCCGKLYKRAIIEENHLRFDYVRLSEDSLFNTSYLKFIKSWKMIVCTGYSYIHRRNGENATAKFFRSDIDVYIELYRNLKELPVNKGIIKKTIYTQFLAICLRAIKNKDAPYEQRESDLKYILGKPYVRSTLLTTVTTMGEWMTGLVVCTGNLRLYSLWVRFVDARGR